MTAATARPASRILLVNPVSLAHQHEAFDCTCLYALATETDGHPVTGELTFIARPNHAAATEAFLSEHQVALRFRLKKLWSNSPGRLASVTCYFQAALSILARVLFRRVDRIVLMVADNTITPRFLRLFGSYFQRRGIRVDVLWHNNIENLHDSPIRQQLWVKACRTDCINIAVLEEFMVEAAAGILPTNKFWVWPFPVPSFVAQIQAAQSAAKQPRKDYDFLVSGNHVNRSVNSEFVEQIHQGLKLAEAKADASVAFLGEPHLDHPAPIPVISLPRPNAYGDYLTALSKARFLLFPPDSARRQTASGVMLDAIAMGIPIVAPDAVSYRALYQDCPAGRALLYDPESGPQQAIARASGLSAAEYLPLVRSMQKFAAARSADKFAQRFWRAAQN